MSDSQILIEDNFTSLAPNDNADNATVYIEALEKSVKDHTVYNVALTGPYGSGKSSVLRTYVKKTSRKSIEISLASFDIAKVKSSPDSANSPNDELHRQIEFSILQQLFYQVDPEKIQLSGVKRIKAVDWDIVGLNCVRTLIFILGWLSLMRPSWVRVPKDWLPRIERSNLLITVAGLLFLAIGIWPLLCWVFEKIQSSKFSAKLNLSYGEIELKDSDNTSIFNKHLQEIIYLFESTDFDIVVFEDLDRFNDVGIFTKLREINSLVNTSLKSNGKDKKRKVVFIYALKDELLVGNDRTKFFDAIVPVIPIVDTSNAFDKALELNKGLGVSEGLLSDVTLYINDMRLLKNIFNEVYVYKCSLGSNISSEEQLNNLFAMIVYKNLFPEDFSRLHKNEGIVFDALNFKKKEIINVRLIDLDNEISEVTSHINHLKAEQVDSHMDLKRLYVGALIEHIPDVAKLFVDGTWIDIGKVAPQDLRKLDSGEKIVYKYLVEGWGDGRFIENTSTVRWGYVEEKVDSRYSYNDRFDTIIEKIENSTDLLVQKLNSLSKRRNLLEYESLSNILKTEDIDKVLNRNILYGNLLGYLLERGHINEQYSSIISFFYPNSMTTLERDFIQHVKEGRFNNVELRLINCKRVAAGLNPRDYNNEAVLNIDLLDYLVGNSGFESELSTVIDLISIKSDYSQLFLATYLSSGQRKEDFLKKVCHQWSGFWEFIEDSSDYDLKTKQGLLELMLLTVDLSDLKHQNKGGILGRYISENLVPFGNNLSESDKNKLLGRAEELNAKFVRLDFSIASQANNVYIFDHRLFELNLHNIVGLVEMMSSDIGVVDLVYLANLTAINKSKLPGLQSYIEGNIDKYIVNVYENLGEKQNEDADVLLKYLNDDNILLENREIILAKQAGKIAEIENVPEQLWPALLGNFAILPSWANILKYYSHGNYDESILLDYLNDQSVYSSFENIDSSSEFIENFDKLCFDLMLSTEFSDDAFDAFSVIIPSPFDKYLLFSQLSGVRIKRLLEMKLLNLTADNYIGLKSLGKTYHIDLAAQWEDVFANSIVGNGIDENDLSMVLSREDFTPETVTQILVSAPIDLFANSDELCSSLSKYLFSHQTAKISFDVLSILIQKLNNEDEKLNLVNREMDKLDENQIVQIVSDLGSSYLDLFNSGRRKLKCPNSSGKLEFFEKLKSRGLISSIKPDGDEIEVTLKRKL
jgi:hypothetical protein